MLKTDATGLEAGWVAVPLADRELPAYRALPAGGQGLATVLVVQEIFGVHEYIQDVCRRLAHAGYLAIAPELYVRQGDPTRYTDIASLVSELVVTVHDDQVMADLDAAAQWAGANGGSGKLGVTGFCWGGRIVWKYAAHSAAIAAGVAWYGPVARSYAPGDPTPLDVVARIRAPILALYGAADGGIPNESVERMLAALNASGNAASELVLYPETPHAFHADYRPSYRAEPAADGWTRMLNWFERHLA